VSEILQQLQDERGKLQQQIQDLQKKVDALLECEKIFKTTQPKAAPQVGVPTRELTTPAPLENTKHADIAEKILRERGPLTADAIARLFKDEGRTTTTNSLRTILSREKGKRFERNKKGEWFVKKGHKGA
jgi:predicted HTH transcriptional regulator